MTIDPGAFRSGIRLFSRPHLLLRACAFAILCLTLGGVVLMLRIPLASVDADMGDNGAIILFDRSRQAIVDGTSTVAFRSRRTGEQVALPASLLPGVTEPRGTAAENALYWHDRDRLAAMIATGPVDIVAGDARFVATARTRSLSDLSVGFWLSMIAGAIAALVGLWVWVLRPRAWAPAMFAASGIGLFVGCATTALNISPGLGLSGRLDQAMLVVNYLSGLLCAGTLTALFARFPLPLLSTRWLWLLAIVSAVVGLIVLFDAAPNTVDIAILVVSLESVAILLFLGLQGWRSRNDPAHRAGLMPIAIGTGVSVLLFGALTLIGQVGGGRPLVQPDMTAPLLLLTYLGLGIAITRARLFALGRWALAMLLSASAILLFVVLDAVLLAKVTQQRDLAFFIAAVVGAVFYLPAREALLRRAERLRDGQTRDFLRHAGDMALAPTAAAAQDAWRAAAAAMFDPLEVDPVGYRDAHPAIRDGGSALYWPSPIGTAALLLRYPGGGARMFAPPDLDTAIRFAELVRRLIEARDGYMRGVSEERSRIARDLHDDVSARLLTSLHRTDTGAMQEDVRGAMADIRTIVTGLSGEGQSLHALLANLRHETQMRLEAAGIALDWPLTSAGEDQRRLDYGCYRNILSVVRESVTNIIRHAAASQARIRVDLDEDMLVIVISDDGRGVDRATSPGNGLANARRRAESLGGSFMIAPVETGGTASRLRIPLR
jgi:two-component system sensor histidine kinase DevS